MESHVSWRALIRNRRGQSLVEYALLLALLCIGVSVLLAGMGTHVRNTFGHGNDTLASADAGDGTGGTGGTGNGNGGNGNGNGNGNGGNGNGNGNGNGGNGNGNGGGNGNGHWFVVLN
jgi:Flp pilus assembly pilin Flp